MRKCFTKFSAGLLLGVMLVCGTFGATTASAANATLTIKNDVKVHCVLSMKSTQVKADTDSISSVNCGVQLSYQFYSTSSGSFDSVVTMPKTTGNGHAGVTKNYPSGKNCNYAYSVHYGNSKSISLIEGSRR